MKKTYTLDLTVEELAEMVAREVLNPVSIGPRLRALWEATRADRENAELRLPWKATELTKLGGNGGQVVCASDETTNPHWYSMRAAKLMAAAPELLEAVTAAYACGPEGGTNWRIHVLPKIEKAMRKLETGIPE